MQNVLLRDSFYIFVFVILNFRKLKSDFADEMRRHIRIIRFCFRKKVVMGALLP